MQNENCFNLFPYLTRPDENFTAGCFLLLLFVTKSETVPDMLKYVIGFRDMAELSFVS